VAPTRVIDHSEAQDAPLVRVPAPPTENGLARQEVPISAIIDRAVELKMDPAGVKDLVALFNQQEDRKAAREFAAAMAGFQAECPSIAKTSTAEIATNSGAKYSYTYAELDEIARTVQPILAKHGLSYSWDSAEDKGAITCTCIIKHANGHRETAKFSCPTDSAAKMSGAQRSASALTYARRQSLVQALGLTTTDSDRDGADRPAATGPAITEHQAANLDAMLDELKGKDPQIKARFLKRLKVEKLGDILAVHHAECVEMLETKRKEQGAKS